jgi:ADP-ribosyl-[dinitrogen reductase] hydrolase
MIPHLRGALIGLAVGDALGAAVEFGSPGSFAPVTGYRSGGPHGLKAEEWTDDTSMALALADSMASAGWDLNDQARRYVEWWQTGKYSVNGRCFDIGITTRSALSRFVASKDALASGDPSERASGNGSIMRLAPVPVGHADLYPDHIEELSRLADESSLPTHASEQCRSACRYLATVLAALVRGEDRAAALSPDWRPLRILNDIKPLHQLIQEVAQGSFRRQQPPAVEGSGWVVKSLEAALWAFHDADSFEEAVLRAVNLGDDADTTGAICGQLAGAFWGESQIPDSLRSGLARMDMLDSALAGILARTGKAE